MVHFYPSIDENHIEFINAQPLFFVASAPLAGRHINLSPKGHPARSFAILDANTVAYLDATGSGCETISHVYENGRSTVMFCSFGASPKIMRLFCSGRVVEKEDKGFHELKVRMGSNVGITGYRAIILLHVFEVQTSCGFAVPVFGHTDLEIGSEVGNVRTLEAGQHFSNRDTLDTWASKMSKKNALLGYQRNMNFRSLDGLTGMRSARRARGQWMIAEDAKAWSRRVGHQWDAVLTGVVLTLIAMASLHCSGLLTVETAFWSHRQ
ncbi:pyridoxamine phosphate oxidase family protein [Lophiotrema nucula]|uniref:Pyridoxamine phosphate oxidase family protein n=1 Tax=Lophiotrema nucula TaxID=690887 RepID=A0A6A5ZLM8_9PLEO|nr:pyridoxamine phosphate oxidase family protein [Lophiotrema nucula]